MSRRVVMILTNDCVSDPRVEKEAAALVDAGYGVTILAWDRAGGAPETEERNGFHIERLGPRATYGGGLRSLGRFRGFWELAARRAIELQPDVIHCHDLDTAPVGLRVARALPGVRLILDYHELYRSSRMVPQDGLVGVLARAVVDILDRRVARRADLLVVANPGNVAYYDKLAPGRVMSIENAPDADMFYPRRAKGRSTFTIGYIGQKRYIETLKLLMGIVQRHPDMSCLLAGGGVAAEEVERLAQSLERVEVVGRLKYSEIPEYYSRCDAVWAVYDSRVGNVKTALFVKVLEGMACGLPVVVNAGIWASDYITGLGAGVVVDEHDIAAVEAALVRLKDDPDSAAEMGRRGREAIEAGMSWQAASARLLEAYQRVGGPR